MVWRPLIAYLFGGMCLMNAVPHLVAGVMGKPFQSPFARPPGVGLSSSTVNVLWGVANLVFAYLLLGQVGAFDPRSGLDAVAVGLGVLLLGFMLARHFSRLNGGSTPGST